MSENRLYKAIILNDYKDTPYATWVKEGSKKIETRSRVFAYRGDIIICCGKTNSESENSGKALCVVEIWKVRKMVRADEESARCLYKPKLQSYLLRNWRHFNYDFDFLKLKVSGAWQGIFEIRLPDDVIIIPKPEILPYPEPQEQLVWTSKCI